MCITKRESWAWLFATEVYFCRMSFYNTLHLSSKGPVIGDMSVGPWWIIYAMKRDSTDKYSIFILLVCTIAIRI